MRMKAGGEIEVGIIGRERTSGIPLLMDGTTAANDKLLSGPGCAIKIHGEHFHHLRTTDKQFSTLLNRYLQAYANFLGQLTGCNRYTAYMSAARAGCFCHTIVSAVTRCRVTHEYFAMMLGIRRSGMTLALTALQRSGYIR
jgi:hypothetical protein